ncbi:MAG: bifunctional 2-polyprenyl-6-hydroxyphenol methylase/3-demethylubiquinol 3-O-methyltransferase UbiG [Legionella sp.]|nr:bifunctional 2-polyprenyl-6-hydroxyphenol methylase/3-demethylubiquinol 3-O-methyltransferase UbiG [Legionella sp.]
MAITNSTIIDQEIKKFSLLADDWWDLKGPLKTLHHLNPARLQFIEQQIQLAGNTVLDIGCGGGILSEAMTKLGASVTGIDAESTAIETAKNHAAAQQLSIDYHCRPIEEFIGSAFDVITCMELLEHVNNPILVLEHCKRLLKPEGLLFLSTINRTAKAYATAIIAAEYILGLLPKQTHDYEKFIKPSELNTMARSLDLKFLGMSGLNYNPITQQATLSPEVQVNYLMCFKSE